MGQMTAFYRLKDFCYYTEFLSADKNLKQLTSYLTASVKHASADSRASCSPPRQQTHALVARRRVSRQTRVSCSPPRQQTVAVAVRRRVS